MERSVHPTGPAGGHSPWLCPACRAAPPFPSPQCPLLLGMQPSASVWPHAPSHGKPRHTQAAAAASSSAAPATSATEPPAQVPLQLVAGRKPWSEVCTHGLVTQFAAFASYVAATTPTLIPLPDHSLLLPVLFRVICSCTDCPWPSASSSASAQPAPAVFGHAAACQDAAGWPAESCVASCGPLPHIPRSSWQHLATLPESTACFCLGMPYDVELYT